ncbi:MAG: hypothetical protein ABJ308_08170 [Halieaceae bacterium]
MVKKLPTKAEQRAALERETRRYLKDGGEVKEVARGISGTDPSRAQAFHAGSLFNQPRTARTLVPEVVAAIESRRNSNKTKRRATPKRSRLQTPRRKVIYDDFGEPIRKVWVDD